MTTDELNRLTQRYLVASFEEIENDLALPWTIPGREDWSSKLNERCYELSWALSVGDVAETLALADAAAPQASDQEKRILARRFLEVQLKTSMAALKALSGEPLETPSIPEPISASLSEEPVASPSISDVARLYAEERISSSKWSPRTAEQNQKIYALIADLLANKMIGSISKADIRQLGLEINRLPANMAKRHPGKTGREVLAMHSTAANYPTLKPRSVNKHYQLVRSLFAWAADHDLITSDPSKVLHDVDEGRAQDARSDFSDQDVAQLFRHLPTVATEPYGIWIPRIMALTGCRMGEAAQLRRSDIREESGLWVFDINEDHPEKDVKTSNSVRLIPVHPRLIELGLLDFVASSPDEFLFPERVRFTANPSRGNVDRLSKQLNRWLNAAGVTDKKKTFQSFRGTMATRLKNLNVPEYQISEILGHENENISSGRYGKRSQIEPLHAAISRVVLPVT